MGLASTASVENRKFPLALPVHLTPPLAQFRLEFRKGGRVSKDRAMFLSDGGKSLPICAFVDIQYQSVTDRRTDGRIC